MPTRTWIQAELGCDVVVDNLSSQKSPVPSVRAANASAGAALRCLPSCSLDLDPIELAFATLKKSIRDGADRTTERLGNVYGEALDEFTPNECLAYVQTCGYRYI
ncbi:MAG: hypothetical protein VX346_24895 [Planctomycetota bacterium]|nr:hypothetical protein [Planctomycetota bacterium]